MFLVLELADNDFSTILKEVLELIYQSSDNDITKQEYCSKNTIVSMIAGKSLVRASHWVDDPVNYTKSLVAYLNTSLKVSKVNRPEVLDHDGGSAALDLSTGYVWTF